MIRPAPLKLTVVAFAASIATGATLKTRLLTLARKTPALVNKTGPNGATLDLSGL